MWSESRDMREDDVRDSGKWSTCTYLSTYLPTRIPCRYTLYIQIDSWTNCSLFTLECCVMPIGNETNQVPFFNSSFAIEMGKLDIS